MTKTELQQRFDHLGNVLYLSRNLGYFSSGQRTCLHIERAAIMRAMAHIDLGETETGKPSYTIPEHLEAKCNQIMNDFA